MSKKRAYRATAVKNVNLEKRLESAPDGDVRIGLDIGKAEVFAVVRWADGSFERPWKVKNPTEIGGLVSLVRILASNRTVRLAMESTGTYGDALRQALTDAKLNIHRVSAKAVQDYAEIFDGVPSKHDGKDAAIIAELIALGKSWPWPFKAKKDDDSAMAYGVDWLDAQQSIRKAAGDATAPLRTWPPARRWGRFSYRCPILRPGRLKYSMETESHQQLKRSPSLS